MLWMVVNIPTFSVFYGPLVIKHFPVVFSVCNVYCLFNNKDILEGCSIVMKQFSSQNLD